MRVSEIQLRSFKRFADRSFSCADEETGLAKDLLVIVGANGTGKSTILQAIAATVGTATGRLANPEALDWPGFSLTLSARSWEQPAEVDIQVEFSDAELTSTQECWELFKKKPPAGAEELIADFAPGMHPSVRLSLKDGHVESDHPDGINQFHGRSFAGQAWRQHPQGIDLFRQVGSVYWYTEQRTQSSLTSEDLSGEKKRPQTFDLPTLRNRLQALEFFHRDLESRRRVLRPGERDIYQQLERLYQTVFPERRFAGVRSSTGIGGVLEHPLFNLHDGQREYELCEMSGGERAVFPLLLDFVNLNINHSIILIDEVELHLHPPMQQALLRALTSLGTGNQFILTTHSDWVADVVPPGSVLRVEE